MRRCTSKPKLLVVGSMNMDLVFSGTPRIPVYGESVRCGSYSFIPGGKGTNQAFAAAKLGSRPTLVGRVGDDEYGRCLMSELEVAQVDTRFIVRDVEAQTGFALMCVAEGGRYVSYHIAGANLGLDASAVERALKGGSFDMVILQLEIPLETVYRTYELSKKNGVPVFLDAGPAMSIDLEPFKGLHIISPNEAETVAMSGIEPQTEADARDAAELLFERAGPRYVILKLGGRGAYFFDGADGRLIPAFVVNAIDSTAAGDTFNAALVTRLCRGDSIEHAITVAHAAAAICVSRKGALPSIPAEAEVDAFLRHEQASRRES